MYPNDCRLSFALLLLVAAAASLAHATDIKYCGNKDDYPVLVKGVDIQPNPVQRGKTAKFSLSAITGEDIEGGKLVIDVEYFGFNVREETHNLCTETSCPVSAGDFVVSHSQSLPIFTPPGTYTIQMKMLGENGTELTCVSFEFSIGFFSSVVDI